MKRIAMEKQDKAIKYIGYCFEDILRFTPLMLWGKLLISIVEGVMAVWQPILIADICELASNLTAMNPGIGYFSESGRGIFRPDGGKQDAFLYFYHG